MSSLDPNRFPPDPIRPNIHKRTVLLADLANRALRLVKWLNFPLAAPMAKATGAAKCLTMSLALATILLNFVPVAAGSRETGADCTNFHIPILLYHRLGVSPVDSMTITTKVFEKHLDYLSRNGYRVIPLRSLIAFYYGKKPLPPKSVVLTVDDGHKSIFTQMMPLVKKYNIPVTLFIYPSAISNADYALTWEQLRTLKRTGLFDIQSHTYWHPNFRKEKKRLSPGNYVKFVDMQLRLSKAKLEKELGGKVDMLAWPFGEIPDRQLMDRAASAGYIAGFTIVRRPATDADHPLLLPRFLMTQTDREKAFVAIVNPVSNYDSAHCRPAARQR